MLEVPWGAAASAVSSAGARGVSAYAFLDHGVARAPSATRVLITALAGPYEVLAHRRDRRTTASPDGAGAMPLGFGSPVAKSLQVL